MRAELRRILEEHGIDRERVESTGAAAKGKTVDAIEPATYDVTMNKPIHQNAIIISASKFRKLP